LVFYIAVPALIRMLNPDANAGHISFVICVVITLGGVYYADKLKISSQNVKSAIETVLILGAIDLANLIPMQIFPNFVDRIIESIASLFMG
jgi:hypothetical protein